MRLVSLTLHGFKSFGDRTTLSFAGGINAIVGPNGSGKSNVIEALRWATGGGRASEYRAGEKTDLIFHGASGKRSVSYAEVELELQEGQRTHRVARSLFRDGSSKLKLDGKNARFIDIDERLSGTGLGRSSLAMIGQGEVGQVLMASPEKLLDYVAEASGVARLSTRRAQAEARLEVARTHLERLEQGQLELLEKLEALREAAQQAQWHTELSRDALALRFSLSLLRVEGLRDECATLRTQEADLEEALSQGRRALSEAQESWRQCRREAEDAEVAYRRKLAETEQLRGNARVAAERLKGRRERLEALGREQQTLAATRERLAHEAPPAAPEGDLSERRGRWQQARAELEQAQAELTNLEQRAATARAELLELQRRQTELERAWAQYHVRREQLEEQAGRLQERLAQFGSGEESEPLHADLEQREATLAQARAELEARLAELQRAQQRAAEARAEAEARRRAAERAKQALLARHGYAQGPKHALASGLPGLHGSVADLIRAPGDLHAALASALGRRAEYIVVETAEDGQRVIEHVRKAGGWVTVLPLELLESRPVSLPAGLRAAPGVLGLLVERLEVAPRFEVVLRQLLGSSTLIEDMAQAVALARCHAARPRLITLAGEVLESYGAMAGGQSRAAASVIGAASEAEDAEAAAGEAQARAEDALADLRRLQARARDEQERVAALEAQLASERQRLRREQEARAVEHSLRRELERQAEQVRADLAALVAPEALYDAAATLERERSLAALQAEIAQAQAQLAQRAEAEREQRQALALGEERWRQYEQQQQRYAASRRELDALERAQAELERQRQQALEQFALAERELAAAEAALPEGAGEEEARYHRAQEASREAEARLAPLSEDQARRAETLEAVRLTLARREAALELAEEEHRKFPAGVPRLELSVRSCRERLGQVEAELEAIGPVNHRASLDLERASEQHQQLEAQLADAREAVSDLGAALRRIDQETTARLGEATQRLRQHFERNVLELFGYEARAGIEVQREDGRPTGLEIFLQPPGKQTQSLNLLSVGERTMGAMAFLFSLMQGDGQQGLAIAVLDEVDAPLDEANIRRFCTFLERLAERGTQFILITHQKATFEVADTLWGVTSDRGVSRVFSIRREEAELLA